MPRASRHMANLAAPRPRSSASGQSIPTSTLSVSHWGTSWSWFSGTRAGSTSLPLRIKPEAQLWSKVATASSTGPGSVELLLQGVRESHGGSEGRDSGGRAVCRARACLEQLKEGTSYGNMLVKSGILKSEGRMAEQSHALWRERWNYRLYGALLLWRGLWPQHGTAAAAARFAGRRRAQAVELPHAVSTQSCQVRPRVASIEIRELCCCWGSWPWTPCLAAKPSWIWATGGYRREGLVMVQYLWCFRNQTPWTRPMTHCKEYLHVKLFRQKKINCVAHCC